MHLGRVTRFLIELFVGIAVFGSIIFFMRSNVPFMLILIQLAALFIFNISFLYYMTKHEKFFEIPDYWKRKRQVYMENKYAKKED
jgi:hypothetical protein